MGFTHHNRNPSFKQPGERSGFPGKTYRPLSTTFGGRLSSKATRWAVPWLHLFVCSMGGLSGNQPHNHSLALQIKKCIYTLLSRETTSNQFGNIRRVECTKGLTEGHLGFCWSGYGYTCRFNFNLGFESGWDYRQDWNLQSICSYERWQAGAHVEVVRFILFFISFIQHSSLARLQLQYRVSAKQFKVMLVK